MNEIWKDVIGYEDRYSISNLGNLKAKSYVKERGKYSSKTKEKILSKHIGRHGYMIFKLCKNKKTKTYKIHQLVAMAFLNHTPCGFKLVIDHINDNKLDNRLENLQVVTNRFNSHKTQGNYSSNYKGVNWHKASKKWTSQIIINKKKIYLGLFKCELAAHITYINKLKEIV